MPRSLLRLLLVACLAAIASYALAGPGDPGTPAADFALQEFPAGPIHTLSEHHGEVVLLFMVGYG